MAEPLKIPTISLYPDSTTTSSKPTPETAEAIRSACRTYGFFQLQDHGVPVELQEKVFAASKLLFDLPLDEKLEMKLAKNGRGYERLGSQILQEGTLADLKEGFYIGADLPADHPEAYRFLRGPNQWPDLPAKDFKDPIMEYRQRLIEVTDTILNILSDGIECDRAMLQNLLHEPVANLKLLHYPPHLSQDPRQFGAGPHTDFGIITFVLQQPSHPGLQAYHAASSTWIPIPAAPNTFVVNIGDLFAKWTDNTYPSALHRVINVTPTDGSVTGQGHRYSIPFFWQGALGSRNPWRKTTKIKDGSSKQDGGDDEDLGETVEEHIVKRFRGSYEKHEKD